MFTAECTLIGCHWQSSHSNPITHLTGWARSARPLLFLDSVSSMHDSSGCVCALFGSKRLTIHLQALPLLRFLYSEFWDSLILRLVNGYQLPQWISTPSMLHRWVGSLLKQWYSLTSLFYTNPASGTSADCFYFTEWSLLDSMWIRSVSHVHAAFHDNAVWGAHIHVSLYPYQYICASN